MNRTAIVYAVGTPAEVAQQRAELEAYARRERLEIVQHHSDRDRSVRAPDRHGLAAALAGVIELRSDLLVSTLAVLGRGSNQGLVLRVLSRGHALITADGTRPKPAARAVAQVVLDGEALAQRIRQVPSRRASEPVAAPEQRVNVNDEIALKVEAIKVARARERLGLAADPKPAPPREGSAVRPHATVLDSEGDVPEPEPSTLDRAIHRVRTDYENGRRTG